MVIGVDGAVGVGVGVDLGAIAVVVQVTGVDVIGAMVDVDDAAE